MNTRFCTRLPYLPIVLAIALLGALPAHAADARYEIDPEHLTIGFLVRHLGYADTLGFFRKASGSYTFDEATRRLGNVKVVVETGSVFTGHDKRDGHLRGSDFLDASRAPRMTFSRPPVCVSACSAAMSAVGSSSPTTISSGRPSPS